MALPCTWGDELTLKAVCMAFGVDVTVITSESSHYLLEYTPEQRKLDRSLFVSYISPIHYNTVALMY